MRVFRNLEEFRQAAGQILGVSDWVTVSQERIDRFAEATGDHQWIHVDRERAKASPFGSTIAHGYLTLSLISHMSYTIYRVDGLRQIINYGSNKVRFLQPVRSGSRVRGSIRLLRTEDTPQGLRAYNEATVEIEGSEKPACVAETIALLQPA